MAQDNDNKYDKYRNRDDELLKKLNAEEGDESEGESGSGEAGTSIEFHDFLGSGELLREDLLTEADKKRLLTNHKDTHEVRVKKQKETRDQRKALKEGKIPLHAYRQGLNSGMSSQYKINPVLADKAQFSGMDRQVSALPNENVSETNNEKREELQYQYQLRYQPEYAPRFNPKPQYR